MKEQKYYAVMAKCGHVGINKYVPVVFPVSAVSAKEAALYVRNFPRVKRDHKDAILDVWEVTKEDFFTIVKANNNNPYLQAKNKQQQKLTCLDLADFIMDDHHHDTPSYSSVDRTNSYKHKRRLQELYCLEDMNDMKYELANY